MCIYRLTLYTCACACDVQLHKVCVCVCVCACTCLSLCVCVDTCIHDTLVMCACTCLSLCVCVDTCIHDTLVMCASIYTVILSVTALLITSLLKQSPLLMWKCPLPCVQKPVVPIFGTKIGDLIFGSHLVSSTCLLLTRMLACPVHVCMCIVQILYVSYGIFPLS